jgi:uncharacterized protein
MRPLVIYHGNCTDGLTAAWVAWRALNKEVDLHAGFYGTEPPDVKNRNIYMLDFSYKRPIMERIAESATSMVILDHHVTAKDDLKGLSTYGSDAHINGYENVACIFDMSHSGARLAWNYFSASNALLSWWHTNKRERPWLIDYVEDRDLWRWQLPNSRLVSAAIECYDRTVESWDLLVQMDLTVMVERGAVIEEYRKQCINSAVTLARLFKIGGALVPAANVSEMRFASDTAAELSDGYPFASTYWIRHDGVIQFSLRSSEHGADVSEVALTYGGGGHKHAAGFQMSQGDFAKLLSESKPLSQ